MSKIPPLSHHRMRVFDVLVRVGWRIWKCPTLITFSISFLCCLRFGFLLGFALVSLFFFGLPLFIGWCIRRVIQQPRYTEASVLRVLTTEYKSVQHIILDLVEDAGLDLEDEKRTGFMRGPSPHQLQRLFAGLVEKGLVDYRQTFSECPFCEQEHPTVEFRLSSEGTKRRFDELDRRRLQQVLGAHGKPAWQM